MTSLFVREIPRAEHLARLRRYPDASHLQIPEWGDVKPDWLPESIGWFEDGGSPTGRISLNVKSVLFGGYCGSTSRVQVTIGAVVELTVSVA